MVAVFTPSRQILIPRLEFPAWVRLPRGVSDERVARMLSPLAGSLTPLGVSRGGIVYLLRDEFTTNASAPLTSPRTCEPGPGTLTITDTDTKISISSSKLVIASGGTAAWGRRVLVGSGIARAQGLALFCDWEFVSGTYCGLIFGLSSSDNNPNGAQIAFYPQSTGAQYVCAGASPNNFDTYTYPAGTRIGIIARSAGAFFVAKLSGVYTLVWVGTAGTAATLYPIVTSYNAALNLDNLYCVTLSQWTDYGIATNRVASPTSPTSTTSVANAIIEFTWTPAAAETLELDVRRTDANNRWIVRCSQAGGTIKLIERNAAAETERSSASQTWSVGTGYRIVVIQDANTIKTFVSNTVKNSYASASFNNTATGVNVAGFATGSNLVCYPRDVSAYIPAGI